MIKLSDIRFGDLFQPRNLDHRFPSIAQMESAAKRRMPKFAWDYTEGGIGDEYGTWRNVSEFHKVQLMPRYLVNPDPVDLTTTIFGETYSAPFGPGPVGLSGLMWPDTPLHCARGAKAHNMPCGLSGVGTNSIEEMGAVLGKDLWFQLYPMRDEPAEADQFKRHEAVGGKVLLVTVDVPVPTRRQRDVGNGLSVPPRQDWRTWVQGAMRPAWAWETFWSGLPRFKVIERYADATDAVSAMEYLGQMLGGHVHIDRLKRYRELWPGKMVVKGVLSMEDARLAQEIGADGIIVSNHGGRQLDAAPTAVQVLPAIKQAVGGSMTVIADGGVRTGSDIAKYLALGADFVLLGRAMVWSVTAAGAAGPEHALEVLKKELVSTIGQLGISDWRDLPKTVYEGGA
ncbi:MAG: alpha-hydroxy acid oxidase [Pseudomonadota bacterium]